MRLGVIIFTLGTAFVAGGITAPATDASAPPPALFGAWVQQGSAPTHATPRPSIPATATSTGPAQTATTGTRAVSYFDGISPKRYDFRVDTSSQAFAAWRAFGLESGG